MPLDDDTEDVAEATVAPSAKRKSTSEKKPFKGEVLENIQWDGNGTAFVDYINAKHPQDSTKKYLVIAAWFKRHEGRDTITSNLIYNAYLKMRWSVLKDITQPFRDGCRSQNGYYKTDGKGNYTITGIGLDAADKVGSDKQEGSS